MNLNNKEILKWTSEEKKEILNFIKSNIDDVKYNDIYLAGSRCLGWSREDSDFDYFDLIS